MTMNRAHSSHTPWRRIRRSGMSCTAGRQRQPADHDLVVGDAYIRNVTTDIRSGFEAWNGRAIRLHFRDCRLCIAISGHLHHELDESHYRKSARSTYSWCRWTAV
ncbi:hypothetical protein F2981_02930 [Sinorhizobium meliloti]|nr:hypothetical protein [Sinorhizobium meliloti]